MSPRECWKCGGLPCNCAPVRRTVTTNSGCGKLVDFGAIRCYQSPNSRVVYEFQPDAPPRITALTDREG